LKHAFNWKSLSVIGVLATTVSCIKVRLFLGLHAGSINSTKIVSFLKSLRRHLKGTVILLWDGLPAHRSKEVKDYLAKQSRWLMVERFPSYAPELNPTEYLWAHISGTRMANFCPDTLSDIKQQIYNGARYIRCHPDLGRSFLKHSGLFK
jgi:transposase